MFVGRAAELEALSALAAAGGPAAGIVVGEPGVGKTRLLAEAVRRLELPAVALRGYEPGRAIPLGVAGGLLAELARVPGPGERLESLLFGESGAAAGLETVRVFEGAFRCLVECAPLAVAVDDLQWVDAETLALLDYLLTAAQRGGVPLLVLCAARPGGEANAFGAALRAGLPPGFFVELVLVPLGCDEGIELALQLAPHLGHERAERVWAKAQGSPFWVEALVAGDRDAASGERLIAGRAAGLDLDSGRLFALLVVAAQPLGVPDAAELLDVEEDPVRRAVGVLANRGLVVQEAGVVRVAHDLIREAAVRELPETERRRLHGRLAVWVEEHAGEDLRELRRALEHRHAAGLPTGGLAVRIVRSPHRHLLGREGLALLVDLAGREAAETGLVLQHEAAVLATELGEWAFALELWALLTERLTAPMERAEAALAAVEAAFMLGRAEEAHAFLARARALAPEDPVVAIRADAHEGQVLRWLENRSAEAEGSTERAAAAAARLVGAAEVEEVGERERRAYVAALRTRLGSAVRAGDAVAVAARADEIALWSRSPVEALEAACDAVFAISLFEGLPRLAEARARRVLEESRRLVLPRFEAEASGFLAAALHDLGRLDAAEELAWQAFNLAERIRGTPGRLSLGFQRAAVEVVAASRTDSRRALAAVAEYLGAESDPHYRLNMRATYLQLLARFGTPTASELAGSLAALGEEAEAAGCDRCRWAGVLAGAEALARHGDPGAARQMLGEWDARYPTPRPGPAARRAYVAALLEARVDPAAALPAFEQAAALADRNGQRLLRLWVQLDAAVALGTSDRKAAVAALRAVAEAAEGIGAQSELQLAERQLRVLGVRTWRRGPTRGNGTLSEREREVAELVAAGASNPEIAQALFLSRKTVERHVSHILQKLGARNRVELASLLAAGDGGAAR